VIVRTIVVVLVLGLVGFQRGEEARGTVGAVDELTLEQQVGQVLVLSFMGTTPPEYVREVLRERRVAGVILFGGNITGPSQLRELTGVLRQQGGRPIVAVDQEGGSVRRLRWAGPVAAQPKQLSRGTIRADAAAAARELRTAGVTVTLAPVADVPSVSGAALAGRAFSRDARSTSDAVRASVRGWRSGGVAATAKHFPGLGGAPANTDKAIVTIRRSRAALDADDLPPFVAAIEAGAPLVMVGHARYPALDRSRIASQSQPIIEGVLRGELGFRGVVVTDSMEARASHATGGITRASERAIRAGADLLLLTGRGSYTPVYEHLLGLARQSPSFRVRIRESAARVLALKRRGALAPG
jgi:beta-N-acetylhexosaminidase